MACEICGSKKSKCYEDIDAFVVWELCERCFNERDEEDPTQQDCTKNYPTKKDSTPGYSGEKETLEEEK